MKSSYFILSILISITIISCSKKSENPTSPEATVGLHIESNPSDAKIYLSGPAGFLDTTRSTPYSFVSLSSGNYNLGIGKNGYYPWWSVDTTWSTQINYTSETNKTVSATLVPIFNTGVNVGLQANGAIATASGFTAIGDFIAMPSKAIDGISYPNGGHQLLGTFWGYDLDGSHLEIELPTIKSIRTIALIFGYGDYTYYVAGSTDGSNYTLLIPTTHQNHTALVYTLPSAIDVKYVRFVGLYSGAPSGPGWRYIISEFQLWQY